MQYPIGAEDNFQGVVDLTEMEAYTFAGSEGQDVIVGPIPDDLKDKCEAQRAHMLEQLSMYNDEMMELLLSEEEVTKEMIYKVTRDAVLAGATPVYMGTAFKNKGVQPLLDAVNRFLPSPLDREVKGTNPKDETEKIDLAPDPDKPFVGMAFKIVDDDYGQLTFMRIYQGTIAKGEGYFNQRTGKKERFSRIVRMHSDKREEIDTASAGDIVAIMGIDSASGDTYGIDRGQCTLESMFVPDPVIKIAVTPKKTSDGDKMGKALQRFRKEDPTFRVNTDEETNEILISGMGELHLEVYIERIRREYNVEIEVGAPKVSYRESPTREIEFNYKHKKQTGGSGQFAHIVGKLSPLESVSEDSFEFEEHIVGGRIPKQYIPAIEKGFRDILTKGPLAEFPVVGTRIDLDDGSFHEVDSSEKAFYTAAQGCFREYFKQAAPKLLEPIMKMEIECPEDFQGTVVGDIIRRRGIMNSNDVEGNSCIIIAEIPLSETFGYATDLRSMTQGQGTFSMELSTYRETPSNVQEEIVEMKRKEREAKNK